MTFDERNEKWQGEPRFFQQNQSRNGTPRVWSVNVLGNMIKTEWGQSGGAMQNAVESANAVNVGKKNEIGPEAYALYLGREKCRKKHWEGYREIRLDGSFYDEHITTIDFNNPPENLAFWKPDNSPGPGITKKAAAGKVWYPRKMNGLMFVAWCNDKGDVFLTSRRMLRQNDNEIGSQYTWNDRFPHIVQALSPVMVPRSCILGELVAFKDGKDNLGLMGTFTKSLTPRALEEQAALGWVTYYAWDIAFWDGQDLVSKSPVRTRYEMIHELLTGRDFLLPVQYFTPEHGAESYGDIEFMRELAKDFDWEGFLVVDPDGVFEDRAYNFKGKPDRPGKFAAKVKPEYEDDFIVYWNPEKGYGEFSTKGRYGENGVKSVTLWQLNQKGELVYIANCSSGMTEEMKSTMKPSEQPQGVWRVFYSDRRYVSDGDDTNAIDFPRVDEKEGIVRTDKSAAECINPRL
jgi:hypothetical protein